MSGRNEISVGVIGVGSMGQHHARVYDSLPGVNLTGVSDADEERSEEIAAEYRTRSMDLETLLETVDAVSIAVPTRFHYETAKQCLEANIDVLIEKPFVNSLPEGRDLIRHADERDCVLQVGHIERFNPPVRALDGILETQEIIALKAERLGPPLDRNIEDSAVVDLMIHDIDIALSLVGERPTTILGAGVRNNQHATATLAFESDVVAELTASRVTQKKIRKLDIITEECLVHVDYIDRSIEIHRASTPEYIRENEDIRYRHESIVERPMVESTEPLQNELEAFVDAVRERDQPVVTGEDGISALYIAQKIDEVATTDSQTATVPSPEEVSLD